MKHSLRRTIGAGAVALILLVAGVAGVAAQNAGKAHQGRPNGKTPPAPPPDAAAQPHHLVHQGLQAEANHEGGRHQQPGVGHQRGLVERHCNPVDAARR